MDDLLVYIARELVSNPDEVNVKKTEQRRQSAETLLFSSCPLLPKIQERLSARTVRELRLSVPS